QIFAYLRKSDRQTALILTNLTKTPVLYRHPAYPLSSDSLVLSNIETTHHQHTTSILLQPYETRIYVW
nr:glucohydrolase [Bacillus pacificus]